VSGSNKPDENKERREKNMTKHKRVAAILLAIMMIFTFMPSMAFADAGDPDNVVCTITTSSGATDTRDSIESAIAAVNADGTITVEGAINNPVTFPGGKGFTIDWSKATVAEGVTIAPASTACWIKNAEKNYTYHPAHNWTSAAAAPIDGNAGHADITVYCEYGDHVVLADRTAQASVAVSETKTKYTYTTVAADGVKADLVAEWTIDTPVTPTTYTLLNPTYLQADDHYAIMDDGKPQFYANYATDGTTAVIGDDGKAVELKGTIVGERFNEKAATESAYGTHSYYVEFTFPNGEKAKSSITTPSGTSTKPYVQIDNVCDTPMKKAEKAAIKSVQVQYTDEEGKTHWDTEVASGTHTYPQQGWNQISAVFADVKVTNVESTTNAKIYTDAEGNLTYRFKYADKNGGADINGEAKKLAPNKESKTFVCGAAQYQYDELTEKYTTASGSIADFNVRINCSGQQGANWQNEWVYGTVNVTGTHDYETRDAWADPFTVTTPADHDSPGVASVKCACGYTNNNFPIPKTDDHTFYQVDGAEKVYTVAAKCNMPGFKYKKCMKSDNGWNAGKYNLSVKLNNKTYTYVFENIDDFKFTVNGATVYGHPVLVEGSVTDLADHALNPESCTWEAGLESKALDADVTCTMTKRCADCKVEFTYIYHRLTFDEAKKLSAYSTWKLDEGSTDTVTITSGTNAGIHVFGAVTATIAEGADCTKADKFTYAVPGEKFAGKDVAKEVTSTLYNGPHKYDNKVTFSADGKKASVTQQCQTANCPNKQDKDENVKVQTKDAVVTATENADGSTTYTATLEGFELTDNTKTLFDFTKATVTINGGEELDLNTLPEDDAATPLVNEKNAAFKKLVEVTINGVVIDSDLYSVAPAASALTIGNNKVTVSAAATATNVVGTASGVVKCVRLEKFTITEKTFKDDGVKVTPFPARYTTRYYDTKIIEVAVTEIKNGTVKVEGATVKYAVTDKEAEDAYALAYDLDKVELKDAGKYYVYAQVSKDGYTTLSTELTYVEIKPAPVTAMIDNFTMKQGENPEFKVVFTETVSSGIGPAVEVDPSEYTVTSAGGQNLEDLLPGEYMLLVSSKNYKVTTAFAEGRVGTVTVLTKEGKTPEQDAKAAAEAADLALVDAAKITTKGYTKDSVKAVEDATAALKTAIATGSTEDVKAATAALNEAVKNAQALKTNPMKAKGKTVKANASKKTTIKKSKAFYVRKAKGTVTFKKISGNGKITVSKKGKVTVAKGLKKGKTYSVKVKITASGNAEYKAKSKTVTLKVKVK
jgi:hypothetical protein